MAAKAATPACAERNTGFPSLIDRAPELTKLASSSSEIPPSGPTIRRISLGGALVTISENASAPFSWRTIAKSLS